MSLKQYYPNLASDNDFREKVENELWGLLQPIRDNRVGKEEAWKRYYKIFNCQFDNFSYQGMSKIYIAALRNASETFVSAIVRDLFPNGQWFKVKSNPHVIEDLRAEMLQALFEFFYTKNMTLKSDSLPYIRQLVMYGTSPGKLTWKDIDREIMAAVLAQKSSGENYRKIIKKTVKAFYGPYFRPVDLFNFFAWPETANNIDEAEIVFEDMEMTLAHVMALTRTPINESNPDLGMVYHADPGDMDFFGQASRDQQKYNARKERLRDKGITKDPSDRWNKLAADRRNLTEIYWQRDLDGTGVKSWLITMINDSRAVRIQENPFNDKEPPYLVPRFLRVIGEFYGRSMYESSDRLQYMFNDLTNQTLDSVRYRLNPVTIIDPVKVRFAQSIKRHPGARFLMDPSGFMESAPVDVAATGFGAMNTIYGMIHDTSGAGAAMQGIPAARGRGRQQNTAAGMAQGLQQSSMPLENIVEDLEEQFTKRLLRKTYNLTTQYMDEPILCRILGRDGALLSKPVDVVDVIGDYEYDWMGVVTARNRLITGQQMLNFLNIARSFPPEVMQDLNWEYIIKKTWTDTFGMRDSNEVFLSQKKMFSVDPEFEFDLLMENRDVVVSPADDDLKHMEDHMFRMDKIPQSKPLLLEKWNKHIDDHMAAAAAKEQARKQAIMVQRIKQAQDLMAGNPQQGGKGGSSAQGQRNAPQNQPTGGGMMGAAQSLQGGVQ